MFCRKGKNTTKLILRKFTNSGKCFHMISSDLEPGRPSLVVVPLASFRFPSLCFGESEFGEEKQLHWRICSNFVVVSFMCQLDWSTWYPSIWSNMFWRCLWGCFWWDLHLEMATHSSILAWKVPQTEEPGRLQSMGSERVRLDRASMHAHTIEICRLKKAGCPP